MADDSADWTRTFIDAFVVIGFIVFFVFLVWISFLDTKSSLNQGSALAAGVLGAFINPPKRATGRARAAWAALAVLSALATVACAVGFFNADHGAAGSAVAAAAAGFAALLIDTGRLAQPLTALASSAATLVARQPAVNNDEPPATRDTNDDAPAGPA
jgi:hypothetical protein